jgi:hypothetical protein
MHGSGICGIHDIDCTSKLLSMVYLITRLPNYQLTPSQWGAGGGSATHKEPTQASSADSTESQASNMAATSPLVAPLSLASQCISVIGMLQESLCILCPGCCESPHGSPSCSTMYRGKPIRGAQATICRIYVHTIYTRLFATSCTK